jgi:hypothetical protein
MVCGRNLSPLRASYHPSWHCHPETRRRILPFQPGHRSFSLASPPPSSPLVVNGSHLLSSIPTQKISEHTPPHRQNCMNNHSVLFSRGRVGFFINKTKEIPTKLHDPKPMLRQVFQGME